MRMIISTRINHQLYLHYTPIQHNNNFKLNKYHLALMFHLHYHLNILQILPLVIHSPQQCFSIITNTVQNPTESQFLTTTPTRQTTIRTPPYTPGQNAIINNPQTVSINFTLRTNPMSHHTFPRTL